MKTTSHPMKPQTKILSSLFVLALGLTSCTGPNATTADTPSRYQFPDIIDIHLTPTEETLNAGCFTDAGAWMGFTLPEADTFINGFCGPFSIDHRCWFASSLIEAGFVENTAPFEPDSTTYFPGELFMQSHSEAGRLQQRLIFADKHTALLHITTPQAHRLTFRNHGLDKDVTLHIQDQTVSLTHTNGERVQLQFPAHIQLAATADGYLAQTQAPVKETYVAVSFYPSAVEQQAHTQQVAQLLLQPERVYQQNEQRWNDYLKRVLRTDMTPAYDRIAVKAIVTLLSNWRSPREGLLHEGIIPSHAIHYFIGYWAWDSWRFSAALAQFSPELAKNNMRALFDYQQPDGMIIDCIYTDSLANNKRDSKPPLACWAVDEIYTHNADTAFVKEMYPKLLAYYKWWYQKRDHDQNGLCEFGCTDGTHEAAGWESGMDNAIRFDDAKMLQNGPDAWSFDQESVDLNAYLALECKLLKKFAKLIGEPFDGPDYSDRVADYFFNPDTHYFGDRRLSEGRPFIPDLGCEGYTPLWTKVATSEQVKQILPILQDTTKFSTYIPFPTAAADNPKCNTDGYWRGPIWLDQTYFAIKGLRNYGYDDLADQYTLQVFDRLDGLTGNAPIHENYGTHTGERLRVSHFSWSSSHLLMMYSDFGGKKK